ncbi:hypothetical protein niasHS_015972 [Heterodera schachtii]|uniref:Uncharacterized protein n=1 Tax=Heterodera schachtii TaxID=97005 RepID=A0ABD2I9A6_HETSC
MERRRGRGDGDGLSPPTFGELFLAAVFVHRPSLVSPQPFSSPAGDPLTHRPSAAAAGDRCKEWTRGAQKIGMERLSRTDTPSAVPSGRLMATIWRGEGEIVWEDRQSRDETVQWRSRVRDGACGAALSMLQTGREGGERVGSGWAGDREQTDRAG